MPDDLAVWQRLLEPSDPSIRDLSVVEPKLFQARQSYQMGQPGIPDLCVIELELLQVRQPLQVSETGIGDLSVTEIK